MHPYHYETIAREHDAEMRRAARERSRAARGGTGEQPAAADPQPARES